MCLGNPNSGIHWQLWGRFVVPALWNLTLVPLYFDRFAYSSGILCGESSAPTVPKALRMVVLVWKTLSLKSLAFAGESVLSFICFVLIDHSLQQINHWEKVGNRRYKLPPPKITVEDGLFKWDRKISELSNGRIGLVLCSRRSWMNETTVYRKYQRPWINETIENIKDLEWTKIYVGNIEGFEWTKQWKISRVLNKRNNRKYRRTRMNESISEISKVPNERKYGKYRRSWINETILKTE